MGRRHGAVIEHAAFTHGYDAPAWADEPERFLPEPVKLTGFETDSDLAWQPGAFLRRGVSIDSRDLDARTGMVGSGPLTSENVVGLLEDLDRELEREMPREQRFPSHFLGASLVVMAVWFWKMLHGTSCLALTMPSALWMATTYGLLQFHLQRRRWLLSCYLVDRSGLRRLLWRPWLTTVRCLLTALPLTVVLAVFVAFADQAEWYVLLATGVLVPVLALAARAWPGPHFRDRSTDVGPAAAPRRILTTRIAGSICLTVGLTGCVYYGYHSPAPHELIYPQSIEQTLAAFAETARSMCATVERTLGWAAQAEGLSWYAVTSLSDAPWLATGLRPFLWIAFLANAGMAFGAMARSVEGAMLLTDRLTERLDER